MNTNAQENSHQRGETHHAHFSTVGFAHPPTNVDSLSIVPGMNVADFGSGSGVYTLLIAKALNHSGRIYAVDIQRDLLRRTHTEATQQGLNDVLEVIWGDLESVGGSKIADGCLDLVLASNILFQLPDKAALLREARRVLKATGRLVIIDWSDSFGGMGPTKDDVVSKESVLDLVRANGYELTREFNAGAHHYGLIIRPVAITPITVTQ